MTAKVTARVVFSGDLNPDVDAAIAELRQALPGLVVFGPTYEDLLGRLKRGARNVLRARGEIVTDIEITTIESGEVTMALWVIPGAKTGVMDVPLTAVP
jgi:hypothetical protein